MKDLVIAFAVALAAAFVILALAVYNTWTGEAMLMITRSAAVACLVVPAIAVAVATVIVVQRAVDHHYDAKESAARARAEERARHDAERLVQTLHVAKSAEAVGLAGARQDTELLRAARILASLQTPQISAPGAGAAVRNPWLMGDEAADWDDAVEDSE